MNQPVLRVMDSNPIKAVGFALARKLSSEHKPSLPRYQSESGPENTFIFLSKLFRLSLQLSPSMVKKISNPYYENSDSDGLGTSAGPYSRVSMESDRSYPTSEDDEIPKRIPHGARVHRKLQKRPGAGSVTIKPPVQPSSSQNEPAALEADSKRLPDIPSFSAISQDSNQPLSCGVRQTQPESLVPFGSSRNLASGMGLKPLNHDLNLHGDGPYTYQGWDMQYSNISTWGLEPKENLKQPDRTRVGAAISRCDFEHKLSGLSNKNIEEGSTAPERTQPYKTSSSNTEFKKKNKEVDRWLQ